MALGCFWILQFCFHAVFFFAEAKNNSAVRTALYNATHKRTISALSLSQHLSSKPYEVHAAIALFLTENPMPLYLERTPRPWFSAGRALAFLPWPGLLQKQLQAQHLLRARSGWSQSFQTQLQALHRLFQLLSLLRDAQPES